MKKRSHTRPLLLAAAALALTACVSTAPLQDDDRTRVLRIEQLEDYGLELPENFASYETFSREEGYRGSITIEYEFDPPEDGDLPYLYSLAEKHPSALAACASFRAGNLGARLGGLEYTERNDLFQFGDKSRFGLLVDEGEAYGNFYSMCRGKTAFMVLLGGFYFDDGALWRELLEPVLTALESM